MLDQFLYSIIYIFAKLLPVDAQAHVKLFAYYSGKKIPDELTFNLIYCSIILGIIVFFLKDIFFILKTSLKAINNLRTGRSSFSTVCLEYKNFNIFVYVVYIALVNFIVFKYLDFILYIDSSKFLLSFLLIISGAVLLISRYFAVIKVFPYLFNIKELTIFAFLNFICIIPGLSKVAFMLSSASILGFEKKYAYKFTLYSIVIFLLFYVFYFNNLDIQFFYKIMYSELKYLFIFNVILVFCILKFLLNFISSIRVTRFYLYLFILGLWTILDLYFAKRGL